jgi:hypothetical protein
VRTINEVLEDTYPILLIDKMISIFQKRYLSTKKDIYLPKRPHCMYLSTFRQFQFNFNFAINMKQKRLSQIYFGVKTEDFKSSKKSLELFYIKCDNYSKEETIQGRKLLNNRRF